MTTKPPTRQQIHDLADRRTAELGYPADPPPGTGSHELYHERRGELRARQVENATLELTRRFERDRQIEAASGKREQAERAALEAQLTADYIASAPGTTAADAAAALPDLLHRHRLAQLDRREADLATARRRVRL